MNKQQFVALLKLGLIQSNPQITNRLRDKGKHGDALVKSLLLPKTNHYMAVSSWHKISINIRDNLMVCFWF